MRKETLIIATREELDERYKNKRGPARCSIKDQLDQYSPEYPKNFGVVFFYGMTAHGLGFCKEFFRMDPTPA